MIIAVECSCCFAVLANYSALYCSKVHCNAHRYQVLNQRLALL